VLVESGGFAESIDRQYPLVVHPSRRTDLELFGRYREMAAEYGAKACVRHLQASISRLDSRPELSRINCSTLVLAGDSDQLIAPELAEEMAAGISGARLVVLPETGHLSPLEKPSLVSDILIEWLSN
jgi:pimeloyl-ACP methyl ester carboxylesterase